MKKIPVIIIGAGGVGRALLQQLIDGRNNVAARNDICFDVIAVADSKRWVCSGDGLDDAVLQDIIDMKARRKQIGEERPSVRDMVHSAISAGHEQGILVDVTAQDDMEEALAHALDHGWGIVLANKKPFAGPWEQAQTYFDNPNVRHESTVGGGQPVIATMRYLMDTGDEPTRIEGQLSGTLGYICQRLDEGAKLSQAIAEAKAKGFTEPDPREDLGGLDVMRKVLILARMRGWQLEQADIEVESLYSGALAHLSVPQFMASAVTLDPSMQDRVDAAHAEGKVLRYIAEVEDGKSRVGLKAIPQESALSNLKYISFTTPNYNDEALMLIGKGAGVNMTAAGVVGDMIGLAREQF